MIFIKGGGVCLSFILNNKNKLSGGIHRGGGLVGDGRLTITGYY